MIDNFVHDRGTVEVFLKVSNNTSKPVDAILECVFFGADGKVVDVGLGLATGVPASGVGYEKILTDAALDPKTLDCRVKNILGD